MAGARGSRIRSRLLLALALAVPACLPFPAPAIAESIPSRLAADGKTLARGVPRHLARVGTAPFRAGNLEGTAAAVLGIGGLLLVDEEIRDSAARRASDEDRRDADRLSDAVSPKHDLQLALGLWGVGLAADLPGLRRTGLRAIEALLITDGLTIVVKQSLGRRRPFETADAFDFRPFGGTRSLPSGHASNAFALATVLARSADRDAAWIAFGAVAAAVSAARVVMNVHWTSDAVAGAILGTGVGWVVTEEPRGGNGEGDSGWRLEPSAAPPGIALAFRF